MAAIVENSQEKDKVTFKDVYCASVVFAGCLFIALGGLKDINKGEVAFGVFEMIVSTIPGIVPAFYLSKNSLGSFFLSLLMACGWLVGIGLLLRAGS